MIHKCGIEVGDKIMYVIMAKAPPSNNVELQSLIRKLNYIRRFISNLSGRIEPFMSLVKIKSNMKLLWG